MAVSSEYHVNIVISTKDQSSQATKKAVGSWTELKSALSLAKSAFDKVKQAAQTVWDVLSEGAAFQRAQTAVENLAASYGFSGTKIIEAIQEASNFTIDKMTAMSAANKAMLLGVAQSPAEFERLARYATQLGRAMGKDAASSIDDFVVAAGRQSKMIADNLGLMVSAEDANLRYAESNNIVGRELTDLEKKQAFLQEMLRQAEEKTNRLGEANLDLAGTMEQVSALAKDIKSDLSSLAATMADVSIRQAQYVAGSTEQVSGLREVWDDFIDVAQQAVPQVGIGIAGTWRREFLPTWAEVISTVSTSTTAFDEFIATASEIAETPYLGVVTQSLDTLTETVNQAGPQVKGGLDQIGAAIAEVRNEAGPGAKVFTELDKAIGEFTLKAGMQWKSYFDGVDQQAEDFDTERRTEEARHQEKLEELQRRGQSKAIKIDEEAELQKLAVLQERLEIAFQQQAEFTDKTHQSTRMAKDLQIRTLQGQIAEQQQLLEDYYGGRLKTTGENVNQLIAEENRRHKEAVAGLETEIGKTKELQKQQLGTLMLQTFQTWAELKNIPPEQMLEMRTAIAKEYGLISEEEALLVGLSIKTWENWALDFKKPAAEVVSELDKEIKAVQQLIKTLGEIPSQKTVDVVINTMHGERVDMVNPMFMGGGAPTTTNNYNFNQTVNTQATTANVMRDWDTAKALVP